MTRPADGAPEAELARLRAAIDAVDAQLLQLLNERARLALSVGTMKQTQGLPIFRPEREAQILRALDAQNGGPLGRTAIEAIYREIISACRALERPIEVAFLGPEGTFSEQAALRQFGSSVALVACESIDAIFRAVESGQAAFGVVPAENSTEGPVNRTLDLLLQTPLQITGEVALRIEHHLLARHGETARLARVCAHPQALAQCQQWLALHHATLERVAVSSNGEAARLASQDDAVAAIAGERAARHYGLVTLAPHIQDDPQNTTRFAILGQKDAAPSGRDQTSIILSVPNRAGAVHDMLGPLKEHGVSMKRFESRPARTGIWTYYFYIDLEGHRSEAALARALEALESGSGFFKMLGSYPVA